MTTTQHGARTHQARTDRLILGRYRLEQQLAAGGTAEVWRARDLELHRPVAVKLPHAHLLPDASSRARLEAEARAVAALSHPGIVQVIDVQSGERPAVVLEFVEGETLAARLERDGPMAPHDAARVAAEIGEALYHAHTRGVIHRDVKPANIVLNGGDRARLVDFGIARLLDDASERLTQTGTIVGTLRYMAPEQLRGDESGPRTDLYGLGAVLCETLNGHPPYLVSTPVALLEAQAGGPPPMPGTEPALRAVARACLQRDPMGRPLHAGVVAAALRAWMTGDPEPALALAPAVSFDETIVAPVTSEPEHSPVPADAVAAFQALIARPTRNNPRRTLMWTAALASLLIVVLLGAGQLGWPPSKGAALFTPSVAPSPTATSLPGWVAALLAKYRDACGDSDVPDATTLAAMGQADATRYVDQKVAACTSAEGKGKGRGHGHGGG